MGNPYLWWLELCVKCSSKRWWMAWLFPFGENHTFLSVTNIFDWPVCFAGHLANQWLAAIMSENLQDVTSTEERGPKKKRVIFVSERLIDVLRHEQLEVWICQPWSALSPGRMSWEREPMEVQLGRIFSRWQCRLWQAAVLPQTGGIYENGSRLLRRMVADHCLSHAAIRRNPAGLNLKQMFPINLQVSLVRLMKTNRNTVRGAIHPPRSAAQ